MEINTLKEIIGFGLTAWSLWLSIKNSQKISELNQTKYNFDEFNRQINRIDENQKSDYRNLKDYIKELKGQQSDDIEKIYGLIANLQTRPTTIAPIEPGKQSVIKVPILNDGSVTMVPLRIDEKGTISLGQPKVYIKTKINNNNLADRGGNYDRR